MGEETKKDSTGFDGSALKLHQPRGAWASLVADGITPESGEIPS